MPVPTVITDLSTTASANNPQGGETPTQGDDHLRAHAAFIRQVYDALSAALSITGLTVSGNTTLGDSVTDTLNVGSGGIVKDASGNVGIGANPTYRLDVSQSGSSATVVDVIRAFANASAEASARILFGTAAFPINGAITVQTETANSANFRIQTPLSGVGTLTDRLLIDASGNFITNLNAAPPTLSVNGQAVFALTSNTNLRVSVRGTDGVTRSANLTLA